ncbi:MAG: NAD-dependent DNA ligase LigA, partial [Lachnospiraceae bacterium]|nr:NAD-dependent DNA ligase LigA [Lachnospiraceae bacterium]
AVIRYSDFERMNAELDDNAKYKNPRNLAAGSVRQLDPRVTAGRSVNLIAFALIEAEGVEFGNSMNEQLNFLDRQGFETVERVIVTRETLPDAVREFSEKIRTYDVPSDGLVLVMDDLAYGASLGTTSKFPRNAMAFKWRDEMAETHLLSIEWSASRTGLINPVAVFEPVELEGTTVSRASVHNLSIMAELGLGIGDTVLVYKANMIIPQIAENRTRSGKIDFPSACPACGGPTKIRDENGVRTLFCENPDCSAKQIKLFTQLVSRNALNVDGLSEATLEKFIDLGFIQKPGDLFRLRRHEEAIVGLEGFGKKSFENLVSAAEAARDTTLGRVLFGIGIPGIGVAGGKLLETSFRGDLEALRNASMEELASIENIGEVTARDIAAFFRDPKKAAFLDDLLSEVRLNYEDKRVGNAFAGKTFVITGSVEKFKNRDELKAYIEARGGKVAGSVSAKTDFLINNDTASNSTKNRTAKQLGIPIISEEDFLQMQ